MRFRGGGKFSDLKNPFAVSLRRKIAEVCPPSLVFGVFACVSFKSQYPNGYIGSFG